jgi:hypothetical protein
MIDRLRAAVEAPARVVRGRAHVCVVTVCVATLVGSVVLSGCGGADDARLTTFVGHWQGHSRGMEVFRSGRGREYIGKGASPIVTLTFDVLRVAGTRGVADARIRVTSVRIVKRSAFFGSLPHEGEFGTLRLRHGIITDSITRVFYCGPAVDECDITPGVDLDPDVA